MNRITWSLLRKFEVVLLDVVCVKVQLKVYKSPVEVNDIIKAGHCITLASNNIPNHASCGVFTTSR